jgi:biotin carboxylase
MSVLPRKVVVIVDPLRAGSRMPKLFAGIGYHTVCVLSRESASSFWRESLRAEEFVRVIEDDGDAHRLVGALSPFDVQCIIAGGESGVRLADQLSSFFPELPGNDHRLGSARRDKFDMAESLRKQGLAAIPHLKTGSLAELLYWHRGLTQPEIVVKPLSSAAADGVRFCDNENDIRRAFSEVHGAVDLFGRVNDEVLAQENVARDGVEYTVNSISSRGVHVITDVWRMTRTMVESTAICVYSNWVHPDEAEYRPLADYCKKVLCAVGTRNGPGHSEIMWTPNGPVLIETSSRLEGTCDPAVVFELSGHSQNSLLPYAYLCPDIFEKLATMQRDTQLHARHVYLISPLEGRVFAPPKLDDIRALPSLFSLDTNLESISILERTTDLAKCPGNLYFVSQDQGGIERDYAAFRQMESSLYADMIAK